MARTFHYLILITFFILFALPTVILEDPVEVFENIEKHYIAENDTQEKSTFSPEEKAFIQTQAIVKVIISFDQPPFTIQQGNSVTGYLYDLLDQVLLIAGLKAQYVMGDTNTRFDDMAEAIQNGTADIMPIINSSRQNSNSISKTVPVITTPNVVVGKISTKDIKKTSQLFGKKVAVVKDDVLEYDLTELPQIQKVQVNSIEEGFNLLRTGQADFFLNNLANTRYILQKTFATDLRIVGELSYQEFPPLALSFAVNNKHPELPGIINKALDAVPLTILSRLKEKWLVKNTKIKTVKSNLLFSDQEKAFLESKYQITKCIDPHWHPYEGIDENGIHVGISADYFQVIQGMIPIPIELVKTDSWDETIQFAKARKCDVIAMVNDSQERRKYLNFTKPYISTNVVLVARDDVIYLDGLNSLSGKSLVIVKNFVYEEIVRRYFPNIEIVLVKNLAEGLQKVSEGSAFAIIGSLLPIMPQIQELGLTNLKVAGPTKLKNDFRIGIRNDQPILRSIFNKAIKAIDPDTKKSILRRWYTVSVEEKINYSLLWKISAISLFILLIQLYWNSRLKKEIFKRKQVQNELLTAYEDLKLAKEGAEAANQSKSSFLANMSHELRTPLNAILGFSELMTRDHNLSSEHRNNLETIGRSGELLLSLINDVLEFSKIEAGQMVLNRVNFDLHHMLIGLEKMFVLRAEQKGLILTVKRDHNIPRYINSDMRKIRQILINLLGNAIKYTEQGRIILRVYCEDYRSKNEQLYMPDLPEQTIKNIFFEVEDTGIGIAHEEQNHVFEPFFQSASSQSQQGTGLGLAICRKFAMMLKSELLVKSEIGKGSIFSFQVSAPIVNNAKVLTEHHSNRVIGLERDQQAFRILIVDNNESNRKLLANLMQTIGFKVNVATNGQEAVEKWHNWKPHLIWMDMRMPVLDGYEATKRIKAAITNSLSNLKQTDEVPINSVIIALTASVFEKDRLKVLEYGCDDFIRKPFRENEIFEMIKKHLGVQFKYEHHDQGQSIETGDVRINDEIQLLSKELRGDLKNAADAIDYDAVMLIIERIQEKNEYLAKALVKLLNSYRFDTLKEMFED